MDEQTLTAYLDRIGAQRPAALDAAALGSCTGRIRWRCRSRT